MFLKKHYKFLLGMILYLALSLVFIVFLFNIQSENKFRLAAVLLFAPVIFYYSSFQKLKNRNLFALYMILGTYHFSLFAFSVDLVRYNFLFQLVLLINLLATIASYAFIYFTINKCENVLLTEIYEVPENTQENIDKINLYLKNYQPKVLYAIIEVFILGILSAIFKNLLSGVLLTIVIFVVLALFAALNIYLHSKTLLKLPIKKEFKIKILILIGLITVFIGLQFNYEIRFNVFLIISFVVYIIFLIHFEHLKFITKEINEQLELQ